MSIVDEFFKRKLIAKCDDDDDDPFVKKTKQTLSKIVFNKNIATSHHRSTGSKPQQQHPQKQTRYHRERQQQQQQHNNRRELNRSIIRKRTAIRAWMDVLNKCTLANVNTLIQKTFRPGSIDSEDIDQFAALLVSKTEYHSQFAKIYVSSAKSMCDIHGGFRISLQNILRNRSSDLHHRFHDLTDHDQKFMNQFVAYVAFERAGFLDGFIDRIAHSAYDSIEKRLQNVEIALKVVKHADCLSNADLERLFPTQIAPNDWNPKHRFLVLDIFANRRSHVAVS